jgi:hypothetical protein
MPGTYPAGPSDLHADVVGVELTIDGMLVVADRLDLAEFTALGIRANIVDEDVRALVWDQVRRDLTGQGVLDGQGYPDPAVAQMVDTLGRAERTLECRWFRPADATMIRFVLCRRGECQVIAVRDGDLVVLQRFAPQVGLADMVTSVLGPAEPAEVEPLTGLAAELAECTTAAQLATHGVGPASARRYAEITGNPVGWVEITATQRHPGGTSTSAGVAAGVLDSNWGRLVSLPRRVGGELYGSFLPGSTENLQRALDSLLEFLPAGGWLDHPDNAGYD